MTLSIQKRNPCRTLGVIVSSLRTNRAGLALLLLRVGEFEQQVLPSAIRPLGAGGTSAEGGRGTLTCPPGIIHVFSLQ